MSVSELVAAGIFMVSLALAVWMRQKSKALRSSVHALEATLSGLSHAKSELASKRAKLEDGFKESRRLHQALRHDVLELEKKEQHKTAAFAAKAEIAARAEQAATEVLARKTAELEELRSRASLLEQELRRDEHEVQRIQTESLAREERAAAVHQQKMTQLAEQLREVQVAVESRQRALSEAERLEGTHNKIRRYNSEFDVNKVSRDSLKTASKRSHMALRQLAGLVLLRRGQLSPSELDAAPIGELYAQAMDAARDLFRDA